MHINEFIKLLIVLLFVNVTCMSMVVMYLDMRHVLTPGPRAEVFCFNLLRSSRVRYLPKFYRDYRTKLNIASFSLYKFHSINVHFNVHNL